MNPNRQRFSNSDKPQITSNKFLVPILAIVILMVVAVVVSCSGEEKSESDRLTMFDNTKVEVVSGDGTIPSNSLPEKNQGAIDSLQQGPATIEDLGGSSSSPSSIDDLLKDKEIEIK